MSFPGFVWTPAVVSPRERPQDMMHPSSHRLWLGHPYPTNPWSSITSPGSSPWWLTPSWTTMLTGEFYSFLRTHQLHGAFSHAGSKWCRVHAAHHGHWAQGGDLDATEVENSRYESFLGLWFLLKDWIMPLCIFHYKISPAVSFLNQANAPFNPISSELSAGSLRLLYKQAFLRRSVCAWDSYQAVQS